jgi:hypothetical protein
MRWIRNNKSKKLALRTLEENREDYLATGSSRYQLETVREVVQNTQLDEREKIYFETEIFPMLQSTFEGARHGRRRFFKMQSTSLRLTFLSFSLGAVSATEIVPERLKFYPLLAIAVIGAIATWHQTVARTTQPALDWMAARTAYDSVLSEVVNRMSVAEIYNTLPDDRARFLEMAKRVNRALYSAETTVQSQIRTFQETMSSDVCKERDKEPEKESKDS